MTAERAVSVSGGRYGRLFAASEQQLSDPSLLQAFEASFLEAEDEERAARLREVLGASMVAARIHPGVDPKDVLHVYLQPFDGGPRLFACVLVSAPRLDLMLREAALVFEGFSLEVSSASRLTPAAVRDALERWAGRNYPDLPLPAIETVWWQAAAEIQGEAAGQAVAAAAEQLDVIEAVELPIGARQMPREHRRPAA